MKQQSFYILAHLPRYKHPFMPEILSLEIEFTSNWQKTRFHQQEDQHSRFDLVGTWNRRRGCSLLGTGKIIHFSISIGWWDRIDIFRYDTSSGHLAHSNEEVIASIPDLLVETGFVSSSHAARRYHPPLRRYHPAKALEQKKSVLEDVLLLGPGALPNFRLHFTEALKFSEVFYGFEDLRNHRERYTWNWFCPWPH